MAIKRFDHVNIRTANLEAMVAFYRDILGMYVGPRPNFPFPGAWMYCGDQALVHLVGVDEAPIAYSRDHQLEHFAFAAEDKDDFLQLLDANALPYHLVVIEDFGITQCNIHDPDGNHIHVDFREP